VLANARSLRGHRRLRARCSQHLLFALLLVAPTRSIRLHMIATSKTNTARHQIRTWDAGTGLKCKMYHAIKVDQTTSDKEEIKMCREQENLPIEKNLLNCKSRPTFAVPIEEHHRGRENLPVLLAEGCLRVHWLPRKPQQHLACPD
jgi:hypothetical protein